MRLKIKEFREEMQWTQKELAEKIGNLQRNVSNWETGATEPDCETILKLAELFDITIDELFGRDIPPDAERGSTTGTEWEIFLYTRNLTERQKASLLEFLKTII